MFRVWLQGHRPARLARGLAPAAAPLARLRRAASPAPGGACPGTQRAPSGAGGILRPACRRLRRLCLRLRRPGRSAQPALARPQQKFHVVRQRLCVERRLKKTASGAPQEDPPGTRAWKLKFISELINEIFIHKMNNPYPHYELAGSKAAAYTHAVSSTLLPMHTQLGPHTQRAFCSRLLPLCHSTQWFFHNKNRARLLPLACPATGSAA